MSRNRRKRKNLKLDFALNMHTPAGTVVAIPDASKPELTIFAYGPTAFEEATLKQASEVQSYIGKWPVIWVNLEGLGDAATILELGRIFSLHELALEDSVSVQQRAKVDEYGDQLFLVLRMLSADSGHPVGEQLSLFLGKGFVVTIQEGKLGDPLDPLRERIRKGNKLLRTEHSDYLMYAILDAVVDGYFPVLERLGDQLEQLEDDVLDSTDRYTPARVLEMKRDVLMVRRAIWPTRDAISILIRDDEDGLVSHKSRIYMRDCYDHAMRIMDLIETQREMCSDLMDLYLSSVSTRMNEVMKVLTIITLLFMPATLIAGIYGMNFNTKFPLNMPELNWVFGYPFALSLMAISAGLFFRYSHSKGWTRNDFAELPDDFHKSNNSSPANKPPQGPAH